MQKIIGLFLLKRTRSKRTKRPSLLLPYAGIIQIRFKGSRNFIAFLSQPKLIWTPLVVKYLPYKLFQIKCNKLLPIAQPNITLLFSYIVSILFKNNCFCSAKEGSAYENVF